MRGLVAIASQRGTVAVPFAVSDMVSLRSRNLLCRTDSADAHVLGAALLRVVTASNRASEKRLAVSEGMDRMLCWEILVQHLEDCWYWVLLSRLSCSGFALLEVSRRVSYF